MGLAASAFPQDARVVDIAGLFRGQKNQITIDGVSEPVILGTNTASCLREAHRKGGGLRPPPTFPPGFPGGRRPFRPYKSIVLFEHAREQINGARRNIDWAPVGPKRVHTRTNQSGPLAHPRKTIGTIGPMNIICGCLIMVLPGRRSLNLGV